MTCPRLIIVRETEIDDKKKPDIRLLHLDLPPVSIEVKWAHKWTVTDLEDGLKNQLVGQYLRAVDSTHGIYLLVNAKSGRTWKLMAKKLDFNGLLQHLQILAKKIEREREGVDRLEVIGIDLTQVSDLQYVPEKTGIFCEYSVAHQISCIKR